MHIDLIYSLIFPSNMKKVTLMKSIMDLAAKKAEELCEKSKPYYQTFVAGMEKKMVDDLVEDAITRENVKLVSPIIRAFVKGDSITPIPVPFEMDGTMYTQIKWDRYWYVVSKDGEHWHNLSDKDQIRLYEALEAAGCIESIE